jgi:hypothetical protein
VRPKSVDGKYERAGFIHPFIASMKKFNGGYARKTILIIVVFFGHGIKSYGITNQIADGWISQNISWEPSKITVQRKKKSITLQSEMLWKSVLDDNRSKPIVREHTMIRVHQSTSQSRIIDFDIQLFALEDSLKIGGLMMKRVTADFA